MRSTQSMKTSFFRSLCAYCIVTVNSFSKETFLKKKLYLISYYFAPLGRADGINRSYLVKFLSDLEWKIDVISCANPHAFLRNFQKDNSLLNIFPVSVNLHPVKSFYWGPVGQIAALSGLAPDPFGNWVKPAISTAREIVKEHGIVYAVVPPVSNAKIASTIAKEKKLPLVIDFRDDVFNLSKEILHQANLIVASTPVSLQNMLSYYKLDPDKGIVVFNGYPVERISSQHSTSSKLRIIYAGLLNIDQDPALLARAVRYMEKRYPHTKGKVQVNYYGPKNYYTQLFLRKYLTPNIRYHGYLPFAQILEKITQADLAYTSLRDERKAYCIPSKVFQYISMEVPILATGPDGALKDFINQNQIGRFSNSDDLEAQAEDIYYLLSNPTALAQMKQNLQKIKPEFAMKSQVEILDKTLIKLL